MLLLHVLVHVALKHILSEQEMLHWIVHKVNS
jgi:hypothetical protein